MAQAKKPAARPAKPAAKKPAAKPAAATRPAAAAKPAARTTAKPAPKKTAAAAKPAPVAVAAPPAPQIQLSVVLKRYVDILPFPLFWVLAGAVVAVILTLVVVLIQQ